MTKSDQIVALRESYRPKDINQPSSLNKALKTYFLLGVSFDGGGQDSQDWNL